MIEPSVVADAHFVVGSVCVLAGFAAFAVRKGSRAHRAAGTTFFLSMLALCLSGLWMSLAREIVFTVFLSWLAAHAVLTGWAATRPTGAARWITRGAGLSSSGLAATTIAGAVMASRAPGAELNGVTPGLFIAVAVIGGLLALFDVLYVVSPTKSEPRRLARHVSRMGLAMFLATAIFFLGNNHVLPPALRTPVLLAAPVLLVLVLTVAYAIWARLGGVGRRRVGLSS